MVLASGSSSGSGVVILVVIIGLLYFLPLVIAASRHVPNVGSVAVVNLFLGWTFIGWVVALAMACRSGGNATVVNVGPQAYGRPVMPYPPAPGSPAERGFAPGWYPRETGGERWWDGQAWTEHVR